MKALLSTFLFLALILISILSANAESEFSIDDVKKQTQTVQKDEKKIINQNVGKCESFEQGLFLLPSREQSSGLVRILKTIEGTSQIY